MAHKSSKKQPPITLHKLIGAISFWGTATRFLLFTFVAAIAFLLALSETATAHATDEQILLFIAILASFVVMDFGFVLIARVYPLIVKLDTLLVFLLDVALGALYVVPRIVVDSDVVLKNDPVLYAFFMPIIILAARALIGMLFSGRR